MPPSPPPPPNRACQIRRNGDISVDIAPQINKYMLALWDYSIVFECWWSVYGSGHGQTDQPVMLKCAIWTVISFKEILNHLKILLVKLEVPYMI